MLPALMANPWLMTNALMANPFGFAQAMNQEMDRLFSSFDDDFASPGRVSSGQTGRGLSSLGGQQGARGISQWNPQIEMRQRDNELVISADLPGLKPDDVNIEVDDGILTISGERRQQSEDRQEGVYRSERSYGAFSRSIALPDGVDEDQVRAQFEHGVLEVTVPLPQQQKQRGRRIQIQSGGAQRTESQAGQRRSSQAQQSGQQSQSPIQETTS